MNARRKGEEQESFARVAGREECTACAHNAHKARLSPCIVEFCMWHTRPKFQNQTIGFLVALICCCSLLPPVTYSLHRLQVVPSSRACMNRRTRLPPRPASQP